MKPQIHSLFSSNCALGEQQLPGRKTSGKMRKQIVTSSIVFICLAGLSTPDASAATAYTIVPAATPIDWNIDASWTPTTATQYPGTATGDSALVTGNFATVAQAVNLTATPANPLIAMTLGDTNAAPVSTTVSASPTFSLPLTGATITSAGTVGAVNTISAPILLTGGLTIGASTNNLSISGKITPTAAVARTINNSGGTTLTLGDIDISTAATTAILTFRNSISATSRTNLHGVIANGSSVAAGLVFEGTFNNTVFEIGNNVLLNTYTGTTVLQGNGGGGRPLIFLINSTQPFGPSTAGRLTLGGASNSTAILEAINADRTIPNALVTMQRNSTFQGSNSLAFSGTITTGSSHILTNNITGSAQLVFNGRYDLDNSNQTTSPSDSRLRPFGGTGTTVFNGILADHAIPSADMFGGVNLTSAGTLIINGTATYQGESRITGAGTIQLGNGGTTGSITPDFPNLSYDDFNIIAGVPTTSDPLTYPAFVKKSVVTGGTTGTGSFAVKHSDDIPLSQTLNGGIGLKQIGSGVLTVATPQFNTGANQVGDGISPSKLVVTAAASTESTQTGDFGAPEVHGAGYNNFYQVVTNLEDTSLLTIGQPVYVNAASAALYIHSIDSSTQVTVMGTGITNATSGLILGQNVSGPVADQALKFGAGSSLGTSAATTTVKALSTLAGTGTISGAVTVEGILDPGISIGTLSTGPLTFSSGSTLKVEINTTNQTSDKVIVTGSVVTGSTVNLTLTDLGTDVAMPVGTKLTLIDYTGTWSGINLLTYGGNPVPNNTNITLGANTFVVNYIDPALDGTALTLTVGTAVATPYDTWINSFSAQLPNLADRLPTSDPDKDGSNNLLEFALDGNPADGSNNGKLVISTDDSGDVGTDRDLSVTMAVLNGATLGAGPNGSATLTVGGMVYTIQGSATLLAWDKAISEVTPASTLVPAPNAGWTARTFQVADSNGLPEKRFIRVGVK